ncbi:MAG: hypothetical protein U5J63_01685 [Fodinibius sp.]|nr:hypothetical protein [Fodinibius sp.]
MHINMLFAKNSEYSERDISLVNSLLENLIDQSKKLCRKSVEENGFIFLDSWSDKMGFVKENNHSYQILSLKFADTKCCYYRLIIKKEDKKWAESKVIDYKTVRDHGIVSDTGSVEV